MFITINLASSICPHGYEEQNSVCVECPIGKYETTVNDPDSGQKAAKCVICEEGTYQDTTASTSCNDCNVGQTSNTSGTACIDCPSGQYNRVDIDATISHTCQPCQNNGLYIDNNLCNLCPAGTYNSVPTSSVTCDSSCEAGTARAGNSVSGCVACGDGFYTATQGQSICLERTVEDCVAGKYINPNPMSASRCQNCAQGQYSTSVNASGCTFCSAGSWINVSGSLNISCSPCDPGKYDDDTNAQTACTPCPAGFYDNSNTDDNVSCTECPENTFSNHNNTSGAIRECNVWDDCGAGRYVSTSGTSTTNRICGDCDSNNCCFGGDFCILVLFSAFLAL